MRKILNNFIQTFTYIPKGRKNLLQTLLIGEKSRMWAIICLIFGVFLLLVGPYNYFSTNIALFLVVVHCYGYAYIFTDPEIMKGINLEVHLKRYALLYFFLVCFLVLMASIGNKYVDNIVSIVLLTFILNQQYISYFKDRETHFYPLVLTFFSGLMLSFIFNDLISPFLFCITGMSLLFTVLKFCPYINTEKEDIMKYEATQFIFVLLFFVSFVVHLRMIDVKTYSKRIRGLKRRFRESKAGLSRRRADVKAVDVNETSEKENEEVVRAHVGSDKK